MKTYCLTFLYIASGQTPFVLYEVIRVDGIERGIPVYAWPWPSNTPTSFCIGTIAQHKNTAELFVNNQYDKAWVSIPNFAKKYFMLDEFVENFNPLQSFMELHPEYFL